MKIIEIINTEFLHRHFTQVEVPCEPKYLVEVDGERFWVTREGLLQIMTTRAR